MDEPDGRMLVYVATEIGESVLGNAWAQSCTHRDTRPQNL